ncbi:MAG: calcineurin-like phosphoesterase C-terminal domain-containing protein [Bacteroidales bacterium]|nr:calcineurin-like phosphoesterase C-terminal domain-containing protein [Bacteroidales bacterium]
MKKIIIAALFVAAFTVDAFAQKAYDVIRADVDKAAGVMYVDPFTDRDLTPAPRGFKPVYLSTYARHGARYALENHPYDLVWKTLSSAKESGLLTAEGENLYSVISEVYPKVSKNGGNITPVGIEQHRDLALRMLEDYPSVFSKGKKIDAYSTGVSRVVRSMEAELEVFASRGIECTSDYSDEVHKFLNPYSSRNPYRSEFDRKLNASKANWKPVQDAFIKVKLQPEAFVSRFFTDPKAVKSATDFERSLYTFAASMQCVPEGVSLWNFFTEDEILALWEVENYYFYIVRGNNQVNYYRSPAATADMLEHFITKTDEDLASGSQAACLRFGHDGCIMSLLAFMHVPCWGDTASDPEAVKDIWQNYNIPMASNIRMVFYRNKAGKVIFKMLLNEKNLELPLNSVSGPYYSWDDFKAHYLPEIEKGKALMEKEPVILSGKVTCEGKGVAGVQVSDGVNIVRTDENGEYGFFSLKPQGFVFISTPSGYVAKMKDSLQPSFYFSLDGNVTGPEAHDFELVKEDQSKYSVAYFTDAHLTNDPKRKDLKFFHETAAPALKNRLADLRKEGPVYIMQLGDLSHEFYWYQCEYNLEDAYNTLLKEGVEGPMYSVSGNHDNDGAVRTDNTDFDAEHLYRKVLGPEYFSVNIGGQHWLFMDDIIYRNVVSDRMKPSKGIVGDRSYNYGFTKDQMTWLEKDLSFLADTADIYLCVHAPIVFDNRAGTLFRKSQMDSLHTMFRRFGRVHIQNGHSHRMQFIENVVYPEFRQVILPAFSGIMWTTSPDRLISNDGEASGLYTTTFTGNRKRENHYYSSQFGEKHFRTIDMNEIDSEHKNQVYIEWWMERPGHILRVYEGKKELKVTKIHEPDPYLLLNTKRRAAKSRHLFKVTARSADKPLVVREFRTRDGAITYEETMTRPKPITKEME